MRGDGTLESLGQRCDLTRLCDAAHPADVEDENLGATAGDQVSEGRESGERLPDCERRPRGALNLGERVGARNAHWVLDPGQVELVERARDPARRRHIPERMQLRHDVDCRTDCGTNLSERLERAIEVGVADVVPEARLGVGVERPDLHPCDALREEVAGQLVRSVEERVEVLVRAFGLRIRQTPVHDGLPALVADVAVAGAGVVRADRIAACAAEDTVQRLPGRLATEVPERDVDRRGRPHLRAAACGSDVAPQGARVRFDPARVLAQQVAGDRVNVRFDRVREEERLAEPDESLVGMDEDVQKARELVQAQRVDARDLHRLSVAR